MTTAQATTRARSTGAAPRTVRRHLSETDRELLTLVRELEADASWARGLLDGNPARTRLVRGTLEAEKLRSIRRLRRMSLGRDLLREEHEGTGYRDARMFFAGLVLYFGALWRKCGTRLTQPQLDMQRESAREVSARVGRRYPKLRSKLLEQERVEKIAGPRRSA